MNGRCNKCYDKGFMHGLIFGALTTMAFLVYYFILRP